MVFFFETDVEDRLMLGDDVADGCQGQDGKDRVGKA